MHQYVILESSKYFLYLVLRFLHCKCFSVVAGTTKKLQVQIGFSERSDAFSIKQVKLPHLCTRKERLLFNAKWLNIFTLSDYT